MAESSPRVGDEEAYPSRRRREIARIIDDMNLQLEHVAESHCDVASRRLLLKRWYSNVCGKGRLAMLTAQAGRALLNRNLRKVWNGWIAHVLEKATALMQLQAAASRMKNRGLVKALNVMIGNWQAQLAALDGLAKSARMWVNAATARGWRPLVAGGRLRAKFKRAAKQLLMRNQRKVHNTWQGMVAERARRLMLLRGAAKSFSNRAFRKAWNAWESRYRESKAKLVSMQTAAKGFVNRAIKKGFTVWKPLAALRQQMRLAGKGLMLRHRRKVMNTWTHFVEERIEALEQLRGAAKSILWSRRRRCLNSWKEGLGEKAGAMVKLKAACATMLGGQLQRAFNTWTGRQGVKAAALTTLESAMRAWAAGAIGVAYLWWKRFADMAKNAPEGAIDRNRPISPSAQRRVKWARARAPTAPTRSVPADDKYQCQRALLAPHASLALRYDGALLRVVGVHKFGTEAHCVVDLVRGYDELLLSEAPPASFGGTDMELQRRAVEERLLHAKLLERVHAGYLSPPDVVLIVPAFFGGVLTLVNELEVRVVDAKFEPSKAPPAPDDDDDRPISPLSLTAVLLALVDEEGFAVGRPSWTPINELLELLNKDMVLTPEFAAEGDLRRRRRLQLHKAEQRRHALHHLRLRTNRRQLPSAWGETAGGSPLGARAGSGGAADTDSPPPPTETPRGASTDGVQGLLQQLKEAAPSKLLSVDDMSKADGASLQRAMDDGVLIGGGRRTARAGSAPGRGSKARAGQPRWKGGTVPLPFSSDTHNKDRLGRAL